MTQLGEAIAVTTITDPDRPHWVQVEYKYANGRPVKGRFLATDSEGMTWAGTLNDQGQACLSGLPPGSVEFELVSEDIEDELVQTRADIKTVLDGIIAEQREEAAKHEAELARQSALGQAGSHYGAYLKGIWNGAVGLVVFAKDVVVKTAEVVQYLSPFERLNNALHAAYKSYHDGELNAAQWKQSFVQNLKDEEIKDIARILGIDPSHLSAEGLQNLKNTFAEAYEITAFIADDPETLDMLTQFGKDYAGAQSSIEWAEFAGGGVFEIVLAALLLMFTGGAGNVAQGASKIRHAGKLKSLGSIFRNLGKLLKRQKLRKKVRVEVDTKRTVQTELPEDKKVSSRESEKLRTNHDNIREEDITWPPERRRRFELADQYYESAGYKDYDSHLRGIDFDKPVEVVSHPKDGKLYQYSYLDRTTGQPRVGSYFYESPDVDASKLGFDVDGRRMIEITNGKTDNFLRSTAANIEDWNGSGRIFQGGETQWFNPNTIITNAKVVK